MTAVIVPVYKVEKYLSNCIDSILNQTYSDFRIVLVDDGSPDNCGKICDEYAKNHTNITVIHKQNGGLSDARNVAIERVLKDGDCDYITFADSDDKLHPDFLKTLMAPITESGVKVSVCSRQPVDDILNCEIPHCEKSKFNFITAEDLLTEHEWDYNYAFGKIYHISLFENLRFPVGKNFEDVFTTYKALFCCDRIAYCNTPLYIYFYNNSGISHSPWTPSELVIFDAMKEQMRFYKNNSFTKAYNKEFELFVHHHAYQIARIKENKKDFKQNKKILKTIRSDLRRYLKNNKDKFNVHNMSYSYEAAYPLIMGLYRFASITKAKLLRRR